MLYVSGRLQGLCEAHLYVFYVSWRLWEAHLYVFYVSWKLWEAHLYLFYVSGRLPGSTHSDDLRGRVGPLEKDLTRVRGGERGGGAERLSCTCFTCPGGSGRLICTCFTCPGDSREAHIPTT